MTAYPTPENHGMVHIPRSDPDDEWRAAADRMEEEFNSARRAERERSAAEHGHPIRTASDASLRRLAVRLDRDLQDVEAGDLTGGAQRAALLRAQLRDIACEQAARAALARSWRAREDGTHSWTAFHRRGGLEAVVRDGAIPPSYELAAILDRDHWRRGLLCVLDWRGSGVSP